jgi:hypothetical protein
MIVASIAIVILICLAANSFANPFAHYPHVEVKFLRRLEQEKFGVQRK